MSERQLSADDFAVKGAFRDLVEKAGGVTRAAALCKGMATQSRISQYCSPNDTSLPRVDVIRVLEHDVGEPIVTRVLAEQAGFLLVPRCQADQSADFLRHLGVSAEHSGKAISELGKALADGVLTPDEVPEVLSAWKAKHRHDACVIDDLERLAATSTLTPFARRA